MSKSNKRWVGRVKTVSTYPPEHTFDQPAEKVAEIMADRKVSPKGLGSAIRMVQYFINRGGKSLSAKRRRELEKAKRLLQERREKQGDKQKPAKKRSPRKRRTTTKSRRRKSTTTRRK